MQPHRAGDGERKGLATTVDLCSHGSARVCHEARRSWLRRIIAPITLWMCLTATNIPWSTAATRCRALGFAATPSSTATHGCSPPMLGRFHCAKVHWFVATRGGSMGYCKAAPRFLLAWTPWAQHSRSARMLMCSSDASDDTADDNLKQQELDRPCSNSPPASRSDGTLAFWSEIKVHLLRPLMQHAVRNERYHEAGRLKQELDSLRALLMTELECNIRCRVGNLRQRLQRSEVLQLQQNLTLALALEDFVKARGMSSDLSQARLAARSSSSPHLRRLERVCMMHGMQQRLALRRLRQNSLASAIQWRVRWLRARTEEEKKDRVLCLEHAIAAMVAEERYNEAAGLTRQLEVERRRRSEGRMWEMLQVQLTAQRRHQNSLLDAHPRKLLEQKLKEAVDAEEYEDAALYRAQLAKMHVSLLLEGLQKEIDAMSKAASEHTDEGQVLQEQLSLAVDAEEFETAAQLRQQLDSLERARMMKALEKQLVQYGAKCFTEPANEVQLDTSNQFYYLGNLKKF